MYSVMTAFSLYGTPFFRRYPSRTLVVVILSAPRGAGAGPAARLPPPPAAPAPAPPPAPPAPPAAATTATAAAPRGRHVPLGHGISLPGFFRWGLSLVKMQEPGLLSCV